MITVHHLNNSRSQRVLWLLEELGLPYEIRHYQRDAKTMLAPPELRAVHPLGKSPVIVDGDAHRRGVGRDRRLSGRAPRRGARAGGGHARAPALPYWLHFAEGTAMPPLLLKLIFDRVASAKMPFFAKPIARGIAANVLAAVVTPNLERHLDFMEAELGRSPWFAGEAFSAADIQMSFPVEASALRAGLDARRPRLMDWLARIHARPAWQRARERGGPYSFAD